MRTIAAFMMASLLALPGYAIQRLSISPHDISYLSIEFGEVKLNEKAWVEVGINAPEDKGMDISELTIYGDMYSATSDCPDHLDANNYCVIDIYFQPTALDEQYGELGIKTSEGNILLKLYGTGI